VVGPAGGQLRIDQSELRKFRLWIVVGFVTLGSISLQIWDRGFFPGIAHSGDNKAEDWHSMAGLYSIRNGKPEEQRDLTRLCVRATMHAGYDDAFVDRAIPALAVTLPLITAGCVRVAEDTSGAVVGVVTVTTTIIQGIALLHGLYVDPRSWKRGVGRRLFEVAITRAKELKAGAS
jgi:hypothetical protein